MLAMSFKKYAVHPAIPEDINSALESYHPTLRKILHYRGLSDQASAEAFLNPDYDLDLHDPFLLRGMHESVERILKAIENKEKIVIYSDYDADGIPGGVVLREFFEKIGHETVENYIPHRHDEGYGFHKDSIALFAEAGANLIITIDCGITDIEAVQEAKNRGIDVIITDHHEEGSVPPPAFAIINPKQEACSYPEKVLCGSGVVFKLIQAILSKNRFGLGEGQEKWFLDLVGIATLSDMVPLTGENRALAHYGLKVLQKSKRPGLQSIWKKLGVEQRNITEDDIGFSLAPRLNAASRMGSPQNAFRLLKTDTHSEAEEMSAYLNAVNDERKGVVASLVKEIKKHFEERSRLGPLPPVVVLGNPLWKPALLGLAGNSVMQYVNRPIFLWGRNGDAILKGSCRSDGKTNMIALMEGAREDFIQFGGHKMAGGFAVSHESVHTLEEKLNKSFETLPISLDEDGAIDAEITPDEITWDLYRHIERLAPFGVGNPKPLFLLKDAELETVKEFGKEKNHLEVSVKRNGKPLKAIAFFSGVDDFSVTPKAGGRANMVVSLEKSNFRSYPELRLRIIDIIDV
jgi:single-stranded-DNA-specific exonuclease